MPFKPDDNLVNYDVYPKVFRCGKKTEFHIRPLGGRVEFVPGEKYNLVICALEQGSPEQFPCTADFKKFEITANEMGGFDFEHTFESEQQYFLRFLDQEGKRINQFPVYAVEDDLAARYPFIGDLHMHTNRSDGRQIPSVVAANYRRHGYDFMVISDHRRYWPSLEAIVAYKDVPLEFNIVPGEEVHMPPVGNMLNAVHIVNFGGEYSVNALTEGDAIAEKGTDPKYRSLYGECPDFMPKEEYDQMMRDLMAKADLPEGIDAYPAVCCKWIFDHIRKANGLGIFAHPTWIANVLHVPEKFTDYLMETQPFDAFEVLGGERYFEQNGYQTVRYYEDRAKGRRYPIVGSTDSHNSYESSPGSLICSTIIFAPENERKALIASVKDFYSVAVDTISPEFRLVGENRLVRYGCFLLKNYFPIHDAACIEEGRLMKLYATGTEDEKAEAKALLTAMHGRIGRLQKKYFAF
ncbi:MAG: hypothetical protein E7329_03020 [Clostridiales bacterium]|nr:hypothetical protein [Clostridiales bacterium]